MNDIDDFLLNFNKKYNLRLNHDSTKLDLSYKGNKCLNSIQYLNLSELKELDLSFNHISDIKVLLNVKFEKLEVLNLNKNPIQNIDIY